jgi:hypothetical protein
MAIPEAWALEVTLLGSQALMELTEQKVVETRRREQRVLEWAGRNREIHIASQLFRRGH